MAYGDTTEGSIKKAKRYSDESRGNFSDLGQQKTPEIAKPPAAPVTYENNYGVQVPVRKDTGPSAVGQIVRGSAQQVAGVIAAPFAAGVDALGNAVAAPGSRDPYRNRDAASALIQQGDQNITQGYRRIGTGARDIAAPAITAVAGGTPVNSQDQPPAPVVKPPVTAAPAPAGPAIGQLTTRADGTGDGIFESRGANGERSFGTDPNVPGAKAFKPTGNNFTVVPSRSVADYQADLKALQSINQTRLEAADLRDGVTRRGNPDDIVVIGQNGGIEGPRSGGNSAIASLNSALDRAAAGGYSQSVERYASSIAALQNADTNRTKGADAKPETSEERARADESRARTRGIDLQNEIAEGNASIARDFFSKPGDKQAQDRYLASQGKAPSDRLKDDVVLIDVQAGVDPLTNTPKYIKAPYSLSQQKLLPTGQSAAGQPESLPDGVTKEGYDAETRARLKQNPALKDQINAARQRFGLESL